MDRRKNIDRLVEAYAGLPRDYVVRHQLVVACQLTKENRADVDRLLDDFGVTEDVLFPGYVSDETLVLLYQSAEFASSRRCTRDSGFPSPRRSPVDPRNRLANLFDSRTDR